HTMAASNRTSMLVRSSLALAASLALWGCSEDPRPAAESAVTATAATAATSAAATPARAAGSADVDAERLLNADAERGQWLMYGRSYDEQRFSPLDQINDSNIDQLGLAWYLDLPTNQNVETTPLMVDG